jgi:hypothetical protein
MIIKTIIIGTGCTLATEIFYKPEEQRQDVEKVNYYPLPILNESIYNIQSPTGPTFNMKTEARLITGLDIDK